MIGYEYAPIRALGQKRGIVGQKFDTHPGDHFLDLVQMNPEPIHQQLVISENKPVGKNPLIRYVLFKQPFLFEKINAKLCQAD